MEIRRFEMSDEDQVVALWGRCLPSDPVTPELFREKVLFARGFEPDLCLVSVGSGDEGGEGGKVLGFIHSPADGATAFVNAIFVDPQHRGNGIGTALLQRALDAHRRAGRRAMRVSGGPRYVFPGVDVEAYGKAIEFFRKNGFIELNRDSIAMGRSFVGYRIPEQVLEAERRLIDEGIYVKHLEPRYILSMFRFLNGSFPDWAEVARDTLERHPKDLDLFVIALRGEEVVGYCQCATDGLLEHFGPFGVGEAMRGRGVGTVIFHRCLQMIQAKGCRNVWFAWGGGRNCSFYTRHGMAVTRRFAVMEMNLG
jgi:GNAT superfamily N-acetyltransferase